jgi:glycosyltransferase involved in cell wall biosynthesis
MRVLMLTGGGISNRSGGVGTMMAALREHWGAAVSTRVIDTRGPGGRLAGVFWFLVAAAQVLAARRVDVVHLHMTTRGSVVRKCALTWLAAALGRPVIVHMHGADFFVFFEALAPVWQRLAGHALRRARHVVVLGEGWRRFLIDRAGVAASQVSVVRNGVPPPAAARPAAYRGPVHILFLGRLGSRKGVPELLAALGSEAVASLPWRATLAGDGDVARFRAQAACARVGERIAFPGWVDRAQAAALMASADVLVLPSHHEALPMAVVEALAAGVAVLTTPAGVLGEMLRHGETALLVPPGDVPALTDALVRLVSDASLRVRIGQAGHAVFRAELDVAVTARQMFALYADAATAGR